MKNLTVQSLLALIVSGSVLVVYSANPSIGVAVAKGTFTLDQAPVSQNATLMDGSVVETGSHVSQLNLNNGARVTLSHNSKGRVFGDRLVLERGATRIESESFPIEAEGLRITPSTAGTRALVSVEGGRVKVASLAGDVTVVSANGVILAKLAAGNSLQFNPSAQGAQAPRDDDDDDRVAAAAAGGSFGAAFLLGLLIAGGVAATAITFALKDDDDEPLRPTSPTN